MDLDKAIQSRHSTKKFNSKKPDWRDIIECIDAARYAPTAGTNYTVKFILVDEPEKIAELANAADQSFIAKAQFVVVVCSVPGRLINAYGEKGEVYSRQQAGAAMENFLLKIEEKGLATCWVGYFMEDKIKSILKIPENVRVEAFFPIGYEFEKSRTRKARVDLDNILYFKKYGQERMKVEKTWRD